MSNPRPLTSAKPVVRLKETGGSPWYVFLIQLAAFISILGGGIGLAVSLFFVVRSGRIDAWSILSPCLMYLGALVSACLLLAVADIHEAVTTE